MLGRRMRLPSYMPLLFAASLILLATARLAAGHEGQGPSIDADTRELRQGRSVMVVGDDFEIGEQVQLELWSFGDVYPLGSAGVDGEGHFTADVTVPDEVEDGYAEIQATTNSGSATALVVLVGEGPDLSEGLPGPAPRAPPIWTDPAAIVLSLLIGAGMLAVLYAFARRRRPPPARPRTRRSAVK